MGRYDVNVNVNTTGAGGAVTGAVTGAAGGGVGLGGVVAGVAGGMAVFGVLKGIFDKTVESSASLKSVFKLFDTSVMLILRPIGDLIGALFRPLALALIPMATAFSEWMYGGGLLRIETFLRGIGEILLGILTLQKIIASPIVTAQAGILGLMGFTDLAKDIESQFGISAIPKMVSEMITHFTAGGILVSEAIFGTVKTLNTIKEFDSTTLVKVF